MKYANKKKKNLACVCDDVDGGDAGDDAVFV